MPSSRAASSSWRRRLRNCEQVPSTLPARRSCCGRRWCSRARRPCAGWRTSPMSGRPPTPTGGNCWLQPRSCWGRSTRRRRAWAAGRAWSRSASATRTTARCLARRWSGTSGPTTRCASRSSARTARAPTRAPWRALRGWETRRQASCMRTSRGWCAGGRWSRCRAGASEETPRSWPCGCSSSWPSARRRSGWSARASRTAWPLWSGRAAAARGRC
mmetsp:Transcript_118453/g.317763  ORF Transcript_118453/g.317763 Transcript_118453/m.317763 type:complete len:216 (+) Transcript_118453:303-950(+)